MSSNNPRVYVNGVTEPGLKDEISRGLDFIGYDDIINKNSVVFVKPNLTDIAHKPGITTTPAMIKAVLETLSPLVKKVYVGESDGGNYSFSADNSIKNHGIPEVAKSLPNVEAVNLSRLPATRVSRTICGKRVWVDLPELLVNDIDCLVSVAVLKAHAMTHGTFSMKNLWGCYNDPMRLLHHKDLDYKLALINDVTRNKIQIIDGQWALDGHGPMEGTPRRADKILVGNDPVATDRTSAYLMGLDIDKITHVKVASDHGLGQSDMAKITYNQDVNGQRLQSFKPYKIRLDYLNGLLFRSELMSKIVLDSPLTPVIYTALNATRPPERRTYWSSVNRKKNGF